MEKLTKQDILEHKGQWEQIPNNIFWFKDFIDTDGKLKRITLGICEEVKHVAEYLKLGEPYLKEL